MDREASDLIEAYTAQAATCPCGRALGQSPYRTFAPDKWLSVLLCRACAHQDKYDHEHYNKRERALLPADHPERNCQL